MNPTLLIIDIQNDYFPGGKMELAGMQEAAINAKHIITYFRNNGWPVIFIQHIAIKLNATFFIQDTEGIKIHSSVKPLENETVIVKNYPNSFRDTSLSSHLNRMQTTDLVICGAMSHMCIDTTTRAAFDLGYSCKLISDACATKDLKYNDQLVKANDVQTAFMAALNGTFAQVVTTNEYLLISRKSQ